LNSVLASDLLERACLPRRLDQGAHGLVTLLVQVPCVNLVLPYKKVSELVTSVPELSRTAFGVQLGSQVATIVASRIEVEAAPPGGSSCNICLFVISHRVSRTGLSRLAICPYPREEEESMVIKGGVILLVRPIRPEDEDMHQQYFQ
jgi:hypothetical protein